MRQRINLGAKILKTHWTRMKINSRPLANPSIVSPFICFLCIFMYSQVLTFSDSLARIAPEIDSCPPDPRY